MPLSMVPHGRYLCVFPRRCDIFLLCCHCCHRLGVVDVVAVLGIIDAATVLGAVGVLFFIVVLFFIIVLVIIVVVAIGNVNVGFNTAVNKPPRLHMVVPFPIL